MQHIVFWSSSYKAAWNGTWGVATCTAWRGMSAQSLRQLPQPADADGLALQASDRMLD